LDIGCGWGGLAKFAAENYGCHVTGISNSEEQVKYARSNTVGLPVDFIITDYRDITGTYDKIASVGLFEHVGYKNYADYMKLVNRCLADDGIFLLHTIGRNESLTHGDPWLHKYIFPNHMLPSIKQIGAATEGVFVMEDWHNFSAHYYHTLMGWYNNFIANWDTLRKDKPEYDERFYRMWTYYLLCCAGAFSSRRHQLWQIVFTKRGMLGGYQSVR
jgi:cyclopropane-fatty-acyl-phospholipid synthase